MWPCAPPALASASVRVSAACAACAAISAPHTNADHYAALAALLVGMSANEEMWTFHFTCGF